MASLSYADAVKKLNDAGFGRFKQSPSPSTPELKDRVVGTIPPANQTSAITNEITIIVGSGPESQTGSRREGPDRRVGAADPQRERVHEIGARRSRQPGSLPVRWSAPIRLPDRPPRSTP